MFINGVHGKPVELESHIATFPGNAVAKCEPTALCGEGFLEGGDSHFASVFVAKAREMRVDLLCVGLVSWRNALRANGL
jgi:hypothetical protein